MKQKQDDQLFDFVEINNEQTTLIQEENKKHHFDLEANQETATVELDFTPLQNN